MRVNAHCMEFFIEVIKCQVFFKRSFVLHVPLYIARCNDKSDAHSLLMSRD